MFSVVSDIKNAYLTEAESKGKNKPSNKNKTETGLGLQLSLEDFHIVTTKSR